MWHARVVGGVAVLALGIAAVVLARQLPYHSEYGPGPAFLPTWIGWVLAVGGVVVTAQELRAARTDERFFRPRTVVAGKVVLAIAVAFLLIPALGFAIALALFIGATMRMTGGHRWVTCATAAVVSALVVHQLFARWLDIPLPAGWVGW